MDEEWSRNAKLDDTKEDGALGLREEIISLSAPQNLATWKNLILEVSWSCVHKSAQYQNWAAWNICMYILFGEQGLEKALSAIMYSYANFWV